MYMCNINFHLHNTGKNMAGIWYTLGWNGDQRLEFGHFLKFLTCLIWSCLASMWINIFYSIISKFMCCKWHTFLIQTYFPRYVLPAGITLFWWKVTALWLKLEFGPSTLGWTEIPRSTRTWKGLNLMYKDYIPLRAMVSHSVSCWRHLTSSLTSVLKVI